MLASYFLCGQLLLFCEIEFEKKLRENYFLIVDCVSSAKFVTLLLTKKLKIALYQLHTSLGLVQLEAIQASVSIFYSPTFLVHSLGTSLRFCARMFEEKLSHLLNLCKLSYL
jgi:hypothetical protein